MYKNIAFAVLALSVVVAMVVDDVISPSGEEIAAEEAKETKAASKTPEPEADPYADEYDEYADEDEDYYDDEEEYTDTFSTRGSSSKNSNVEIADNSDQEVEIIVDEPRRNAPHTSHETPRTGGTALPEGLGSAEGVDREAQ